MVIVAKKNQQTWKRKLLRKTDTSFTTNVQNVKRSKRKMNRKMTRHTATEITRDLISSCRYIHDMNNFTISVPNYFASHLPPTDSPETKTVSTLFFPLTIITTALLTALINAFNVFSPPPPPSSLLSNAS